MLAPLCNGDLLQLVEERGAMGEAQAAGVMRAVLTTLAQLHGLGVCHLDVDAAPPNLILRTTQPNPALEPERNPVLRLSLSLSPVSYTHLTLPTILLV